MAKKSTRALNAEMANLIIEEIEVVHKLAAVYFQKESDRARRRTAKELMAYCKEMSEGKPGKEELKKATRLLYRLYC